MNFQYLEHLARRRDDRTRNYDLLDENNFVHCSLIKIFSLFTWARQCPPDEARLCFLNGLCGLVSLLLWERWNIELPGDQLELLPMY